MFHHIIFVTPKNRKRYAKQFSQWTLPKIRLASAREIKKQMREWELV
ncbi:hypothetical protein ACVW2A_004587 [Ewingella americana]